MAVIRCPRGHYYDNAMFSICPHCGVSTNSAESAGPAEKPQRTGFFGRFRSPRGEDAPTVSLPQAAADGEKKTLAYQSAAPEGDGLSVVNDREAAGNDDDAVTVSHYSSYGGTDYVTGWLVCTEGPEKGRDFRIGHGMQKLGRSPMMDLQIAGDPGIAENGHAVIAYDDRSNQFFISPMASETLYLNGNYLPKTEKLSSGDEIGIGKSIFVFIPFCEGGRTWKQNRE